MSTRGVTRVLLACGILSSLLYATMLIFVPLAWPGYRSASQTISELSAIGAPTRLLWLALGTLYTVLVAAFGWGVRASAGSNRPLRVAGGAMLISGVLGLFWPPMHLRGAGFTVADTLHLVWMAVTGLLMVLAVGCGAVAFTKRFRLYSIASLVIMLASGALTSLDAPRIAANLPTPWIGIWERISAGVYLVWVAVLAAALLWRTGARPGRAAHVATKPARAENASR